MGILIDSLPLQGSVYSLDVGQDDTKVLVAADDKVLLVDFEDRSQSILGTHSLLVNVVRYSPDGQQFLSCGIEGDVKLWDSSGQVLLEFNPTPIIWSVDFSNDGKSIICGGRNGVYLWEGIPSLDEYLSGL